MLEPDKFRYGEIYKFYPRGEDELTAGVYVGKSKRGRGMLINRNSLRGVCVHTFDTHNAHLEGNLIQKKDSFFNKHFLSPKEESYALEILNKKSL